MICDLHNDILTANISDAELNNSFEYYRQLDKLKRVTLAIWTTELKSPIQQISDILYIGSQLACGDNKFFYAIEDMHFFEHSTKDYLYEWKKSYNILYAGLTWNYENALAGGAHSAKGLTFLGKTAIKVLEELNVFVDTAHLNKESFWDVVKCSKKPIINSHCCFDAINSNPRNIDDQQIKAIIDSDGLIGLTVVPKFISNTSARIVDVFNHIDYFISRFGFKNLAFGTDFYGMTETPEGLANYNDFDKLKTLMQSHGYPATAINSIFNQNFEQFFLVN